MIAHRCVAALAVMWLVAGCESAVAPPDGPPTGTAVAAATVTPRGPDPGDDQCLVDFLDVGSGLAVFIRCKPSGGDVVRILYDGGTNEPKLRNKGRLKDLLELGVGFAKGGRIDHLIQSHPHFDHHSDLVRANGILQNYDVRHVWDPAALNDTVAYTCFLKDVVDKANTAGLIYHPAKRCIDFTKLSKKCDGVAGASLAFKNKASVDPFNAPARSAPTNMPFPMPLLPAGVSATIFHADPEAHEPNDSSLIVKFELFGVKVLLTGDEEAGRKEAPATPPKAKSVEKFLLDKGYDIKANIVSVPHHGSNTSSSDDFQNAVIIGTGSRKDTYAVISSGLKEYNGVQLPINTVVDAWKAKLNRSRVVSTKRNDDHPPVGERLCSKHPSKISPDPANDESPAGCNNIQFVITRTARGARITSATYWPIGGRI
jgi:beta-lactamase superfamily II metal-dependent hydrolase